jgi:hypothetical protein
MNYKKPQKKSGLKFELSCVAIVLVLFAFIIAGFIV